MQIILLAMLRQPVAQRLIVEMGADPDVRAIYEPDYAQIPGDAVAFRANAALIEIAESGECDAGYCLSLCARLRRESPACRLMLLCPEQDEPSVSAVVEAARDRRIDDFFFYDSSIDFIATKLLTSYSANNRGIREENRLYHNQ